MEIIKIEKAESSNSVALELLDKKDMKEGTVVWVLNQTQGRGQRNNIWLSEPDMNLTISIILKPVFLKPEKQFYLSKAIALGVADYAGLFSSDVKVKWFNDILIGHKKLAGILIENVWLGQKISASVIGIGLNLNQEKFPKELPQAISLKMQTGVPFVLEESLKLLHGLILTRYTQLRDNQFTEIDKDYHSKLYGIGEIKSFTKEGEKFEAEIIEVEPNGHIRVKHSNGQIASYSMQDVRMI
jgi:BirA family transcriptional regulator, biotin operon repressor / biotin---[acetyl-CoA-carboxylase] ligase